MTHSFVSSYVHVVFSTKDRRNLINADLQCRLWAYLKGIAEHKGFEALAVGGTDNHLHVLLQLPATVTIAQAVQALKGNSSKWIHETFPENQSFSWQQGYGAFSIGVARVSETIAYIANQANHHRTRTFEDEYLEFVRRHGLPYDQRHVFG